MSAANEAYPCEKEYGSKNSIYNDLLDITRIASIHEIYSCHDQSNYSNDWKNNTQGSFFHKNF